MNFCKFIKKPKMEKKLLGKVILFMAASLFALQSNAQDATKNVKEKFTDKRGKPSLIVFNDKSIIIQRVLKFKMGKRLLVIQ